MNKKAIKQRLNAMQAGETWQINDHVSVICTGNFNRYTLQEIASVNGYTVTTKRQFNNTELLTIYLYSLENRK